MRRTALCAVVALAGLTLVPATGSAGATGAAARRAGAEHCPAAESLVPGTTWHHHTLASGITLAEGKTHDSRGTVSMHVLRIRLAAPQLRIAPLLGVLTERLPLSRLAAGHRHLVAAINTGYFDFITGAPTGPVIIGHHPVVLSDRHQEVVGLSRTGRAQSGRAWLSATAKTSHITLAINAVNELMTPDGLSVYTHRWGSKPVRLRSGAARAILRSGRTSSLSHSRYVPSSGSLLVARGSKAERELSSIGTNTAISITLRVRSGVHHAFSQAYGVGSELVAHRGKARTGFSCRSSNTKQPARTAIGYADHGRKLVVAIVSEHPHTALHGLDNTQMSKLMAQLGVTRAFDFDGSGSTELLARMPGTHRLSLRNYPADGAERPMPLGLGIYS